MVALLYSKAADIVAGKADDRLCTNDEMTIDMEIRVIGVVRTPWRRREDAPHQPNAAPETEGVLEIGADYRPALADLGSFTRAWLIFLFDRSSGWAARVKPPR